MQKRSALSIVRAALGRRNASFAQDEDGSAKKSAKKPWTVEQTSDDEVTYKFKIHVDKKRFKPVSKELAQQVGVSGNGGEGQKEEGEAEGGGGRGAAQDSAFWVVMDSPSTAVAAARRQCAATIEQCRARNKFACPYHGAQAVKADLIDRLTAAGVNSVPEVEAILNNRGKPTGTYSISIPCVDSPEERRRMEGVINGFLHSPGIDQESIGGGAEYDYEAENQAYNSLFDVDGLNPEASTEAEAHEEREEEPRQEEVAEEPQEQAETPREEPHEEEQPQEEVQPETPQEERETPPADEPQREEQAEQTNEAEQGGGDENTYTVTGADGQPINVKMDWDIADMHDDFGFTMEAGIGATGFSTSDVGDVDHECENINRKLGAKFDIRDATFRELMATYEALRNRDKRGFVDAIARHLKPLDAEGRAERGQADAEQAQEGQHEGGTARMHSALPGEHGSVRITASRAQEGEQSEIIGMDAEDSRNTILRVNNAIRSSGLGPVSNFVVDVHGIGRGDPVGMLAFPVALSVLAANGKIGGNGISDYAAVGSLGIDGEVVKTPAAAIRNMCLEARRMGSRGILVPEDAAGYLSDIDGIDIYPILTLREAADFLNGDVQMQPMQLSRSREMDIRNATDYLRSIGYSGASADNDGVSLGNGTRMSWEEYRRTPIMPTERATANANAASSVAGGENASARAEIPDEPIGSLAEEFERAFPDADDDDDDESFDDEPHDAGGGAGAASTSAATPARPAPAPAPQPDQPQQEEAPQQTQSPSQQSETPSAAQPPAPSQPIPATQFSDMAKEAFTRAKNAAFSAGTDDRVAQARGRALSSVLGRANGIAGGHTMAEIHDRLHDMMGEAVMRNDRESVEGYQQALDMVGNEGGFTPRPFDVSTVHAPEVDYSAIEHGEGDDITQSEIDAVKNLAKAANINAYRAGHNDSSRSADVAQAHALSNFLSRNGGLQSQGGVTRSGLMERMRDRLRAKAGDENATRGTERAISAIGRVLNRGDDQVGLGLLRQVQGGNGGGRQTQSTARQETPQAAAQRIPPPASETPAAQPQATARQTPQPPSPRPARQQQPPQPQATAQQQQAQPQPQTQQRQGNNGFAGRRAQAAAQRLEAAARNAGTNRVRSILERIRDNARRLGGQGQN